MEHLLLKAATTVATDQGEFEAVISTATIDREKDIVDPAGFVKALHKWIPLGKKIPLAWNHSSRAEDQIGYVDPASARVQGTEVVVKGKIDLGSDVGQHAWRMVKMGTLGFSFGYLVPPGGSTPRKGGGRHIKDADVYEITATNAPMNGDTRVLSYKAVVAPDGTVMPAGDMMDENDAAETPLEMLADCIEDIQAFITGETVEGDSADVRLAERLLTNLQAMYRMELGQGDDGKSLRERAEALALELATEGVPEAKGDNIGGKGETDRDPWPEKGVDMPPGAEWLFPLSELDAARAGEVKAVWTTSYVNDLPDSSFLYVEGGGDKDSEGKTTPRSLRHFPYKDASGAVDLPHLRNALARIPQSSLSQDVKDRLTSKAQAILDNQKSVDATDKETKSRSVDPLRRRAESLALEITSGGLSLTKATPQAEPARPQPQLDERELKRKAREETLIALSGETP